MKRRTLFRSATLATVGLSLPKEAPSAPKTGGVRKGYVDGPFGQIHYYEAGTGPALVLAHQSPVSARQFERGMLPLASRGLRAIAVDTPGYGNSDVPPNPPSIADYAAAFRALVDELGLERSHFLGHHTGGSILCNFAARFPERVASLTLNGPPLFSDEDLERLKDFDLTPAPIAEDGSHLQARWQRRARFSPGWTDKEAMHRRVVDQLWAGDTGWYGHNAAFNYQMRDDFMALQGRVMILTNTGDDIYDLAQRARKLRPELTYRELEGGTHDIVDEQPEAWADAVAEFVLNKS